MSFSQPYNIAPVVYEYVWNVDNASKQTSTYTTTFFGPPGSHTAYTLVVNTALPSPSQFETIGILYTILPGGVSTQYASATVATHSPTAPVLHTDHSLVTPAAHSPVQTPPPKVPCHELSPGHVLPLQSYFTYLQIVLVCLFCGGYLWFRCSRRHRHRDRLEKGRGAFRRFDKPAIYELA